MTPSKLLDELPDQIKVGAYDLSLRIMSDTETKASDCWGYFCAAAEEIALCNDWPSSSRLADVLLHEIEHALFWAFSVRTGDEEERVVKTTSTARIQIYRDNPWLLTWLKKALG